MSDQTTPESKEPKKDKTFSEKIEVAGNQLVEHVKELIKEGNVRRLILRDHEGKVLMEIPLTTGVVVGGVITWAVPL
ncbi:MAG: DUF4342 domain-containing protein, partial [Deinococcus sp.]|nr:DUF4342 domain-containing protein [Deinococcus sp.]